MPLAADIRAVRDRALAESNAAHDYYYDTVVAWALAAHPPGRTFTTTNRATGTVTTQATLPLRIRDYVTGPLAESTFQTFLAVFEAFFTDLVRAWLRAYPKSLSAADPVPVDVILDAPDKPAITEFLIDRAVAGLLYRKPADWFEYVERRLKLGCPTADEVARLAEAKATRDVLIHNRGVANEVYAAKAGGRARFTLGQRVDIPEPYHRETWDLLRKMVADLSDAVAAKFP